MSFLIHINATDTDEVVAGRIDLVEGKAVGELNFSMEELLHNGVYVLKENNNVVYVGKASSRIFLERFAGHFDTRGNGGFNNLLKGIAISRGKCKKINGEYKFKEEDLKEIWRDTLSFKMVCISYGTSDNQLLVKKEKELMEYYNRKNKLYNRTVWNIKLDYQLDYEYGDEVMVELKNGELRKFKIESASSKYGYIYGRIYNSKNILSKAKKPQSFHIEKLLKNTD